MTDSDDVKKKQSVTEQTNVHREGLGKKALWLLSPPMWLMISGIVLIFALNFFCIIKVMTLEIEKNQFQIEKNTLKQRASSLQADIERHTDILKFLPTLESQKLELEKHIANLQGTLSDLIRRETELIQNIETRQNEFQTAIAERSQADAAATSARKEAGRLQSEISAKEEERGVLEITVEKLQQDEVRQRSITETLASRLKSLETDIDTLTRNKETKLLELEDLSRDNNRLVKVNTDLMKIAKAMDESRKMADAVVNFLKATTAKAEDAVTSLETHVHSTEKTVQGLTRSSDNLSDLMESIGNDKDLLKTAIKDLGKAGKDAEKQVKRLSSKLDDPIRDLNQGVSTLAIHIRAVGDHADAFAVIKEKIAGTENDFTSVTRKIESSQTSLGQEVDLLQKEKNRLAGSLSDFETSIQVAAENTMKSLKTTAFDLAALVEKIEKHEDGLKAVVAGMEGVKTTAGEEVSQRLKQLDEVVKGLNDKGTTLNSHVENVGAQVGVYAGIQKEMEGIQAKFKALIEQIGDSENKMALNFTEQSRSFTEKRLALQTLVDELSFLQKQMEAKGLGVGELIEKLKQSVDSANTDVEVLHAGARQIESGGQKLADATIALNIQIEAVETAAKNLNVLMERTSPAYIFRPENPIDDPYSIINEHKEQSK